MKNRQIKQHRNFPVLFKILSRTIGISGVVVGGQRCQIIRGRLVYVVSRLKSEMLSAETH